MEAGFLRFGDFRIDLQRGLLYHDDRLLEPERKEFELLRLLVEAHPETLTRRELIDRLWPRQEISDASLAQLIRRTRKLLDDDAHQPRYLKTLHGIGLRLIPTPRAETPAPPSPARRRIGLLPVINASGQEGNAWVEHGLSAILLQKLEQGAGLSVQLIPGPDPDKSRLMSLYGCEALLQMQLEPGMLPRKLRWRLQTAALDRDIEEQVEANSIIEAAERLAERLPDLLGQPGSAGADRSRFPSHSGNPQANRRYGEGLQSLATGNYIDAEQGFRDALAEDPHFHWARVKLADALYRQNHLESAHALVDELLSREDADTALTVECRQIRSNLQYTEGRLNDSLRESAQLIGLAQALGDRLLEANQWMNLGTGAQSIGDERQAFDSIRRALAIYQEIGHQPGIGNALYNLGNVHHGLAEWTEAYSHYEQAELAFEQCRHINHQAQARFEMAMVQRGLDQPAEQIRHQLEQSRRVFEQTGDREGLALVDVELLHCAIDEGCSADCIAPLETLLEDLARQQLEYPRFLARHQLIRACLNQQQTRRARDLLTENQEYRPNDPSYDLLQAHCAYEERDFRKALKLAEAVSAQHRSTWKTRHQELLETYRQAVHSNCYIPMSI